jgi:hypothetical protein
MTLVDHIIAYGLAGIVILLVVCGALWLMFPCVTPPDEMAEAFGDWPENPDLYRAGLPAPSVSEER